MPRKKPHDEYQRLRAEDLLAKVDQINKLLADSKQRFALLRAREGDGLQLLKDPQHKVNTMVDFRPDLEVVHSTNTTKEMNEYLAGVISGILKFNAVSVSEIFRLKQQQQMEVA